MIISAMLDKTHEDDVTMELLPISDATSQGK